LGPLSGEGEIRNVLYKVKERTWYLYYEYVAITASLVLLALGPGQAPEAFTKVNDLHAIFLSLREIKEIFGLTVY